MVIYHVRCKVEIEHVLSVSTIKYQQAAKIVYATLLEVMALVIYFTLYHIALLLVLLRVIIVNLVLVLWISARLEMLNCDCKNILLITYLHAIQFITDYRGYLQE